MEPLIARQEIRQRLEQVRSDGKPIIVAGCSAGIIAKCAAIGGADLIVVYSTGRSRIMGLPTFQIGDSNAITLEMADEISNVVQDTPLIGGLQASDPTRLDLKKLLARFVARGFSAIINFPTVAMWNDYRVVCDKKGLGFEREVQLIRLCDAEAVFSLAYVFSPEDSTAMAGAGADCIVAHLGPTEGGLVGPRYDKELSVALRETEKMFEAARKVRPDIVCLGHGGPFVEPDDTVALYAEAGADGFVGASSIERVPIEHAIRKVVTDFKSVSMPSRDQEKVEPR